MQLLLLFLLFAVIRAKKSRIPIQEQNPIKKQTNGVDTYSEPFHSPVDFGHVNKNGENKAEKFKTSLDIADLGLTVPENDENDLLNKVKKQWRKKDEEPRGFLSPRDSIQYYKNVSVHNTKKLPPGSSKKGRPMWFDYAGQLERNFQNSYPRNSIKDNNIVTTESHTLGNNRTYNYFDKKKFHLESQKVDMISNWTNCNEFSKTAYFHPDDVVDIDWLPFYIWSLRNFDTAIVHKFSYPTRKIVQQFKEEFGPFLNKKVDWQQPKLLLKESKTVLLVAGDRKGLFYGIPYTNMPEPVRGKIIKLPVLTIRLKIQDPYLAMMYCEEYYAVIMSTLENMPASNREKISEASTLKFKGVGLPAERDIQNELAMAKFAKKRSMNQQYQSYINTEK